MKHTPVNYGTFTTTIVATGLLLLAACAPSVSPDRQVGGDISVVDNIMCGTVSSPDGKPAVAATVTIRPADYVPVINSLAKRTAGSTAFICSTRTDSHGYFRFTAADSIPAGYFIVEARDEERNRALIGNIEVDSILNFYCSGENNSAPEFAVRLQPPATLCGVVTPSVGSASGFAALLGLDAIVPIQPDGSFNITDLPPGKLKLRIAVTRNGVTVLGHIKVALVSNVSVTVDTLYQIIYNGNAEGGVSAVIDDGWHSAGDTIVIPLTGTPPTRSGYIFTGWNTSPDGSGEQVMPGEIMVIQDSLPVLYAQWVKLAFCEISPGYESEKGTVTCIEQIYPGVAQTITAIPKEGYTFAGWKLFSDSAIIGDTTAATTTLTVYGAYTSLIAFFECPMYRRSISIADSSCGNDICRTADGGYIITGYVYGMLKGTEINGNQITDGVSTGTADLLLVKTDPLGDTSWTRTYRGYGYDAGTSVRQTTDGGYIIAGMTMSFGEDGYPYLMKTDATGELQWSHTCDPIGISPEDFVNVRQTTDGGYIVASSNGNLHLMKKFNTATNKQWEKTVNNFTIRSNQAIEQTADGGFIIAGTFVDSAGNIDPSLLKIDRSGNTVWMKTYYNATWTREPARYAIGIAVCLPSDSQFILMGEIFSPVTGLSDIYLVKTTASGDTIWTGNGGGNGNDPARNFQLSDWQIVVTGYDESSTAAPTPFIATFDDEAFPLSSPTHLSEKLRFKAMTKASGVGLCITGSESASAGQRLLIIKTDESGNYKSMVSP